MDLNKNTIMGFKNDIQEYFNGIWGYISKKLTAKYVNSKQTVMENRKCMSKKCIKMIDMSLVG